MKLVTKFIWIYLAVTVVVLAVGGVISFHIIKNEVAYELRWQLYDQIDRLESLIEDGRRINGRRGINSREENYEVRRLDEDVEPRTIVTDTLVWHEGLQRMEENIKVSSYKMISGKPYYISAHGVLIESDDVAEAVIKTLLWILGMQLAGAVGIGFLVSGRLFRPFKQTLNRINNFKLQSIEPIRAEKTGVREFDELNRFVHEMTEKAVSDYQNLKEFAENASHELQTPLSIAGGKLDLLMETDLNEEQYRFVESAHRSINKLSRLSKSLSLLTKIENHEFNTEQKVNLSNVIQDSLDAFDELITLNDLTVEHELEESVMLSLHPVLADLMWTNLLQNAIKHNHSKGYIRILLSREELQIINSGTPLDIAPEELFQRFKKGDAQSDSIGLGLSIVKRITDLARFTIDYHYADRTHTVKISFT
jgi:signal transduction histidine kinase